MITKAYTDESDPSSNLMLVDVHAHLDHSWFGDELDAVISRAKKAGVRVIIQNGVNPETNRLSLEMAKKYDIVKVALGIYPIDALNKEIEEGEYPLRGNKFDVNEELEFIGKQKDQIIALGEVGLDDFHVKGKLESQKKTFQKIIELAEKIKKPLIVHSRDAEKEVIDMLESSKCKKVDMHCFSGNMKLVKRAADLGFHFSIPTSVVYNMHFKEIVKRVGINQILTETDAPYLGPVKGERNEPVYIAQSIKTIAELKSFTVEECANNIFLNYKRLFE